MVNISNSEYKNGLKGGNVGCTVKEMFGLWQDVHALTGWHIITLKANYEVRRVATQSEIYAPFSTFK